MRRFCRFILTAVLCTLIMLWIRSEWVCDGLERRQAWESPGSSADDSRPDDSWNSRQAFFSSSGSIVVFVEGPTFEGFTDGFVNVHRYGWTRSDSMPWRALTHPRDGWWNRIGFHFNVDGNDATAFSSHALTIPLWLPTLLTAAVLIPQYFAIVRRSRRRGQGRCEQCGYDLRGSIDRCPECGRPKQTKTPTRVPRSRLTLLSMLFLLIAVPLCAVWITHRVSPQQILRDLERAAIHGSQRDFEACLSRYYIADLRRRAGDDYGDFLRTDKMEMFAERAPYHVLHWNLQGSNATLEVRSAVGNWRALDLKFVRECAAWKLDVIE